MINSGHTGMLRGPSVSFNTIPVGAASVDSITVIRTAGNSRSDRWHMAASGPVNAKHPGSALRTQYSVIFSVKRFTNNTTTTSPGGLGYKTRLS